MPTKVSYMDITPISDSTKEDKMKRQFLIALVTVITLAVLSSCALKQTAASSEMLKTEEAETTVIQPLMHGNAVAVKDPHFTTSDTDFLHKTDKTDKKLEDKKEFEVMGEEYTLRYSNTFTTYARGCGIDTYTGGGTNTFVSVSLNENTGKIVRYKFGPENRTDMLNPVAPINENSTEKDYLDLARSMILEYTGVDCGEWEYDVDTYIYHTTYNYSVEDWKSGFMNFIKDDPEFDAEYTFRFYKTLSGLHRGDDVRAVIRNDGTVLEVRGEVYDEAFAPFADVKIDAEELFRRVDGNYSAPGPEIYHRTRLTAIPAEDGLWVEALIKGIYYDEEGVPQWDDVTYAAKVAEYVD